MKSDIVLSQHQKFIERHWAHQDVSAVAQNDKDVSHTDFNVQPSSGVDTGKVGDYIIL